MFAAVFIFVLVNNLVGVIPGMTPATENMNTTLPMGLFIFLLFNYLGLKENGLSYIKHFLGPQIPVPSKIINIFVFIIFNVCFMFLIELISTAVRPISLGLRLANVMGGDHKVVGIFLDLIPIGIPIPFYLMGIFICFVQAFVFTLLSMVYVSLATAHEEH
jgi:F-type H+-transporting ATPase subunit a